MQRIHLTKRIAGPAGNWGPGSTIQVDDTEAKRLVEAGAAELVDAMPEYRPAAKRETAVDAGARTRKTATEATENKR